MSFFINFWKFISVRKKFLVMPIFLITLILIVLIVFGEGSAVSSFNYSIF